MVVDGVYRTGDLVEASVLSMHGMTPSMEKVAEDDSRAVFVFDLRDQDHEFVEELLTDIKAFRCKVEPTRFAREMGAVRGMLYSFLGVGRNRLRQN